MADIAVVVVEKLLVIEHGLAEIGEKAVTVVRIDPGEIAEHQPGALGKVLCHCGTEFQLVRAGELLLPDSVDIETFHC